MEKKLKTTKRKIGKKRQEDKERDRRNKGAKNILTSSMVVPKSGISVYTFHTPREKFGLASKNAVLPRYLPVFDYTRPHSRKPFNDMLTAAGC